MRQRSPEILALEDRTPLRLKPLAEVAADREAVFVEASKEFAARRHLPPVLRPPPVLDDVRFERVLYVHMAALAAVEGGRTEVSQAAAVPAEQVTFDAGSLMTEILQHEERFWLREATDRDGVEIDLPLARQLVAAATLRGGLTTKDEAREMCERLEKRPHTREDDALLALLHNIYDCDDLRRRRWDFHPGLLSEVLALLHGPPPQPDLSWRTAR